MKNIILLLLMIFSIIGCQNDDPLSELDKLPPATQTGANKIGCLLDGKAFMLDTIIIQEIVFISTIMEGIISQWDLVTKTRIII